MRKCVISEAFTSIRIAGTNIINGTRNVESGEIVIPCFDGLSYFRTPCGFFKMTYPKVRELTNEMRDDIYDYYGYEQAGSGDYEPICGCLGKAQQITEEEFNQLKQAYPVGVRAQKRIDKCFEELQQEYNEIHSK